MTEHDKWVETFTTKQFCDFCQKPERTIIRVTVHPIYSMSKEGDKTIKIAFAKKCKACCER